jgi:uncharacterized protein YecT (DUF1311 family)
MKYFIFCSVFFFTTPVFAELCDDPKTQTDINYCAEYQFTRADAELNDAYGAFKKLIANDVQARAHLLKAQRAWLSFRDAECALEALPSEGGSSQALVILQCQTRLTQARHAEFGVRLACQEGDLTCFNITDSAD